MTLIMNEIEEVEDELRIAEHNLWVAKTNVEDREEEVSRIRAKLEKMRAKNA